MLKVYCYSKCTTCKKALKWLDEHRIEFDLADIKENHPDEETLRKYHSMSGLPLKRFFNTSGQIYRDMELSKKAACNERRRAVCAAVYGRHDCKAPASGW